MTEQGCSTSPWSTKDATAFGGDLDTSEAFDNIMGSAIREGVGLHDCARETGVAVHFCAFVLSSHNPVPRTFLTVMGLFVLDHTDLCTTCGVCTNTLCYA